MSTYLVDSGSQTIDDIVNNIIVSCRLPISQITFTPQNIITFLQDEQQVTVTDLIKKIREDYWLTNYDQQVQPNVYAYSMPPRCAAGALRNFCFVNSAGYEIKLPHLDPDQIMTPSFFGYIPTWQGQGAFLQNNIVMLWPFNSNNSAYILRQKYERRPNSLTSVSNCMQIVTVNVSANQITFIGSPPSPPFVSGALIDIISNKGQFVSQGDDLLISSVVGSVLTFDPSTPITSSVTIGSWACPAGLTCIPQLPAEGYPLLLARGMLRIAMGLQNTNLFSVASKMAEDAAAKIMNMFTPRIAGNPRKFVNKNRGNGSFNYPFYR